MNLLRGMAVASWTDRHFSMICKPLLCGILEYNASISSVIKIVSGGTMRSSKICRICRVSLRYECSDVTSGLSALSTNVPILSVGSPTPETIGRPGGGKIFCVPLARHRTLGFLDF